MNLLPTGAHILVAASDVFYVRLHDSDEGLVVEVASSNPRWELRVPDKGVAVDFLLVGFGEVAVAVGVGEGEVATLRLNGLPLHGILWCERVEVGVVASNGLLGRVATTRISCQPKSRNPQRLIKHLQRKSSTDELSSTSLHRSGQTILRLGGGSGRVGDCQSSQRKRSEDLGETHLEGVIGEVRVADESPCWLSSKSFIYQILQRLYW
jgi:hypothetical protein